MKKNFTILLIIAEFCYIIPQTAQSYFPSQTGRLWNFRATPLDSLNNKIDSLTFYEIDSFAVTTNYTGRLANIVLSKSGPAFSINFQPYLDSSFFSFSGTEAYAYIQISEFFDLPIELRNFNFNSELPSLADGWFSVYRFAQNINQAYTIFSFDTTVTIDSIEAPLRIEHEGKRLNDESITTEIGNFLCKKFIITTTLSYLLIFPPIPPIPVEFVSVMDTVWIAPDNWIVKDIVPSTNVDLSFVGLGSYFLPGLEKEIRQSIPTGVEENIFNPQGFSLEQNYPNPFNPTTNIGFHISKSGFVSLKIYDILGTEIATIVDENLPAGNYKYQWNAIEIASGIYFYQLKAGEFIQTRKMILAK